MRRCLGIGSRAKRFFLSSPAKEKSFTWDNPVGRFDLENPQLGGGEGGEEEIFFDSKACIDSDCEDDFLSVNGDFTPSQGNTPDHQTNAAIAPKLDTHFFLDKYPDSKTQPSPTGRKKLGDLLQETPNSELIVHTATCAFDEKVGKIDDKHPPQSSNVSLYHSENSSVIRGEGTPGRDRKSRKSKTWKANHCCLPSLQSFGFDEKKQCSAS